MSYSKDDATDFVYDLETQHNFVFLMEERNTIIAELAKLLDSASDEGFHDGIAQGLIQAEEW